MFEYIQFLFYRQWAQLRAYANDAGIKIIGDIPIYVAMDSAEVWAEPHWFQLDEENLPAWVSGVPPDLFNEDGQLWGNPLYNWDAMEADGFGWWIRRIAGAGELFDMIRIDHFRGLESYYAIKFGDTDARNGKWVKGPGIALVDTLKKQFSDLDFIAEDLGYSTPEVRKLLADSGFPGMRLLICAFDEMNITTFLPHNYVTNCISYTGTHDNHTLVGWLDSAPEEELSYAKRYLALNEEEGYARGVIRGGMSSVAGLFVAQMQDWLELGNEARINCPGLPTGNWTWRMKAGAASKELAEDIYNMTRLYGRLAQ
jgi:4-alpha-glucanotransferase